MPLKKNLSDVEIGKICKKKPVYEETYKSGVLLTNKEQLIKMINQSEAIIEAKKHADLGDGIEAITVKIICNFTKKTS